MFKQRLLTALVIIPLVLLGIFVLPPFWFALFTALVIGWGGWEWSQLMGLQKTWVRVIYVDIVILSLVLATILPPIWVLSVGVVGWLGALCLVLGYQQHRNQHFLKSPLLIGITGIFVLVPCWVGFNVLCFLQPHPVWLLLLFVLVCLADTGAYFAGHLWGKHKLAPSISPGKTWEGVFGGIVVAFIAALIATLFLHFSLGRGILFVCLGMLTVIVSILGDLFESLLKRQQGMKDSGWILPGHGGILDRIDSLTAAVPLFACGLILMGLA
jgi:phosphatidate cytidylyltransferase